MSGALIFTSISPPGGEIRQSFFRTGALFQPVAATAFLFDGPGRRSNVPGMNSIRNLPGLTVVIRRPARFAGQGGVHRFVLLTFLVAFCSVCVADPDDDYLHVFGLIQQADALSANGNTESAHEKYQAAQQALLEFKRQNPTWNPKVLNFRMNYVAGKLAPPAKEETATQPEPTKALPTASPAKPIVTMPALPATEPQIKLLNAGAEPRSVLRLHPQPGDKQSLSLTVKLDMTMDMQGTKVPAMKMPPMVMGLDVVVSQVSSAGDITYEMTFTDASVGESPDASPQVAAAMRTALAGLKGMTARGVTTGRGVSKDVEFNLPASADPQLRQTMDQMKTAMAQVALPEEAVGVGASWQVKRKLKSQGMTIEQTDEYTISALNGDEVTLQTALTQHAANQKVQNPAVPNLKMDLSKLDSKGNGSATLNLGKILPATASMDAHSEMAMSLDMNGKKQSMAMNMDLTVSMESK
jgi:hypothetical protein